MSGASRRRESGHPERAARTSVAFRALASPSARPGSRAALPGRLRTLLRRCGGTARAGEEREILLTAEPGSFPDDLHEPGPASRQPASQAILIPERGGPAEGRPPADPITAARTASMKEPRPPPPGRSEIRIPLAFDPRRPAILPAAGDKPGQRDRRHRAAVPRAEQLHGDYLAGRRKEPGP